MEKRFKRNEAFRYEFGVPLNCEYKILKKEDGSKAILDRFIGKISNISPNGLQLSCEENTLDLRNGDHLEINFKITSETFFMVGEIVWNQTEFHKTLCGIRFLTHNMEQEIIEELKSYAKEQLKK